MEGLVKGVVWQRYNVPEPGVSDPVRAAIAAGEAQARKWLISMGETPEHFEIKIRTTMLDVVDGVARAEFDVTVRGLSAVELLAKVSDAD